MSHRTLHKRIRQTHTHTHTHRIPAQSFNAFTYQMQEACTCCLSLLEHEQALYKEQCRVWIIPSLSACRTWFTQFKSFTNPAGKSIISMPILANPNFWSQNYRPKNPSPGQTPATSGPPEKIIGLKKSIHERTAQET